jgi:site-specific DNA-cytosine methylase
MKCLELFSGIGGFAAACPPEWQVVQAFDISQPANAVYSLNFPQPVASITLESISAETLRKFNADLWWLSPPCQPFTARGRKRDIHDPRCAGLLNLMQVFQQCLPSYLMFENVPLFRESIAAKRWRDMLRALGYHYFDSIICPTSLGIANRRQRYYLIASRWHALTTERLSKLEHNQSLSNSLVHVKRRVADVLAEANWQEPSLQLPAAMLSKYESSMHWVDPEQIPDGVSSCFTSAYGQSPVYSGSYLRRADQARYFAPLEIARLLGFDAQFRFGQAISQRQCWNLVGNSLSIDSVRLLIRVIIESQ